MFFLLLVIVGVASIGAVKTCIFLWNKNLQRHVEELNRFIDTLIDSADYKTNPEKQDSVKEMGMILHSYLSKKII
jgi:hypothetical protein